MAGNRIEYNISSCTPSYNPFVLSVITVSTPSYNNYDGRTEDTLSYNMTLPVITDNLDLKLCTPSYNGTLRGITSSYQFHRAQEIARAFQNGHPVYIWWEPGKTTKQICRTKKLKATKSAWLKSF